MLANDFLASQVARPAIVGLTGALTVMAIEQFTGATAKPVKLLGGNIPFSVAAGLGSGLAAFGAEAAHNFLLPHIPHNERYAKLESLLLEPFLAGGLTILAVALADGGFKRTFVPLFGVGAAAAAAGSWMYTALSVKPATQSGRRIHR